ncbi:hypothetical protein F5Y14DRAFT_460617 [Nemania sp. NC0429]|nr:hypothetical protein F5Y14DRAFT_460617 [Nemania sp. NC0429]
MARRKGPMLPFLFQPKPPKEYKEPPPPNKASLSYPPHRINRAVLATYIKNNPKNKSSGAASSSSSQKQTQSGGTKEKGEDVIDLAKKNDTDAAKEGKTDVGKKNTADANADNEADANKNKKAETNKDNKADANEDKEAETNEEAETNKDNKAKTNANIDLDTESLTNHKPVLNSKGEGGNVHNTVEDRLDNVLEALTLLHLKWRKGKPLIFCANKNCHNIIQNTVASINNHFQTTAYKASDNNLVSAKDKFERPIEPFSFLPTLPADQVYRCNLYTYAVRALNKIKQHYKTAHPHSSVTLRFADVQAIQTGHQIRYVQVTQKSNFTSQSVGTLLAHHLDDDPTDTAITATAALARSEPNI